MWTAFHLSQWSHWLPFKTSIRSQIEKSKKLNILGVQPKQPGSTCRKDWKEKMSFFGIHQGLCVENSNRN